MTNHNDSSRFDGFMEQIDDEEQDLALQAAVLAVDFPKRLERLHEVSGLTWAAFARAIGVDPKLVHRWRQGLLRQDRANGRLSGLSRLVPPIQRVDPPVA